MRNSNIYIYIYIYIYHKRSVTSWPKKMVITLYIPNNTSVHIDKKKDEHRQKIVIFYLMQINRLCVPQELQILHLLFCSVTQN